MMREISDHVLDIAQNSVAANAGLVKIRIDVDVDCKQLELEITDDGRGMTSELLSSAAEPFTTTRTTRNVGLGLPMLKMTAEMTGGRFFIESEPQKGTRVFASFGLEHIDRPPLGDLAGTLYALAVLNPSADFIFNCSCGDDEFELDTREIKKTVSPLPIVNPEVSLWLKEYLKESIDALYGGVLVL